MGDSIRTIKPRKLRGKGNKELPVKGSVLIPELYSTTFLAGKTYSGKTVVIDHLMKHTIDPRTTVIIFCSTVNIDKQWISIQKALKKRGIPCVTFTSLMDDETGCSMLDSLLKTIDEKKAKRKSKEEDDNEKIVTPAPVTTMCQFPKTIQEEEKKDKEIVLPKRKPKNRVPEHLLIFDDLSRDELRSDSILNLIKKNRHYDARVFISTQFVRGITPSTYTQLWYLYLFPGFSIEDVKLVYERIQTTLKFPEFLELYQQITKKPHQFLNIDVRTGVMRHNFGKPLRFD